MCRWAHADNDGGMWCEKQYAPCAECGGEEMIILQMEPDEITAMYREAKNKFKQVQILAEMNCVSNREMAQWLEEHEQKVDTRYFPERRMRKKEAQKQAAPAQDHGHDGGEMIETAVIHEDGAVERRFDQSAKADDGKLQLSLVPTEGIRAVARVRMFGTKKYGDPDNWKQVEKQRYKDALLRHVLEYMDNEDAVDEESGLLALEHLLCNGFFLMEMRRWK